MAPSGDTKPSGSRLVARRATRGSVGCDKEYLNFHNAPENAVLLVRTCRVHVRAVQEALDSSHAWTCAQHIILRGALRPWSPSWRSCPTRLSSTVHTQHRRHMRQRLAPRTLPNAASPDLRDPRFTKPCWRCPRREVDASIPVHMQCNGARPRCLYPKLTSSIPCTLAGLQSRRHL